VIGELKQIRISSFDHYIFALWNKKNFCKALVVGALTRFLNHSKQTKKMTKL